MTYGQSGNLPLAEGANRTFLASGAVSGGRAVSFAGVQIAAQGSDAVWGVANSDVDDTDYGSIRVSDQAQGVSAAAISVGAKVTTSANGRWETAASGDFVFGRAVTSTSAADQIFKLEITREGILA